MKNMRVLITGTSGQKTTFSLTIGSGMLVEVSRDTLQPENPPEWNLFMDKVFEEIQMFYRSDVRDLLDWKDTFVSENYGRCQLLHIYIYDV